MLWLLYPYRNITLGSNKHNGDDALWSWQTLVYEYTCRKLRRFYTWQPLVYAGIQYTGLYTWQLLIHIHMYTYKRLYTWQPRLYEYTCIKKRRLCTSQLLVYAGVQYMIATGIRNYRRQKALYVRTNGVQMHIFWNTKVFITVGIRNCTVRMVDTWQPHVYEDTYGNCLSTSVGETKVLIDTGWFRRNLQYFEKW